MAFEHGVVGGHDVRQSVAQGVGDAVFQIGLVESAVEDGLRLGLSRFQIGDGHAFEGSGTVSEEVFGREGFGGKGIRKGQRHDRSGVVAGGNFAFSTAVAEQFVVFKSAPAVFRKGVGNVGGSPDFIPAKGVHGSGLGFKILDGIKVGGRIDAFGGTELLVVFPRGKAIRRKSILHVVDRLVGPFCSRFGIAFQRVKLVGIIGVDIKQGVGRNFFVHAEVQKMLVRTFFSLVARVGERLGHGVDVPVAFGLGSLQLSQLVSQIIFRNKPSGISHFFILRRITKSCFVPSSRPHAERGTVGQIPLKFRKRGLRGGGSPCPGGTLAASVANRAKGHP